MEKRRQIIFYKNHFEEFFNEQTEKVKNKIDKVLFLITIIERVPKKFLQHMEGTNGIYELAVIFSEYSVVLTKEDWLCFSMDFKRKLKKLQSQKLKKQRN